MAGWPPLELIETGLPEITGGEAVSVRILDRMRAGCGNEVECIEEGAYELQTNPCL